MQVIEVAEQDVFVDEASFTMLVEAIGPYGVRASLPVPCVKQQGFYRACMPPGYRAVMGSRVRMFCQAGSPDGTGFGVKE